MELTPLPPIDIPADANPDVVLMDSVTAHISRTMPAAMEPIKALISNPENIDRPGAKQ
jgi:hypothetical protein